MSSSTLALAATAALPIGALAAGAAGRWLRTPRGGRVAGLGLGLLAVAALVGSFAGAPDAGARSPVGGWAAVLGLAALGGALGGFDLPRAVGRALPLLVAAALLDGAPTGWGLFSEVPPFGAAETASMLDASPRALALETAGVDWMRDPAVYGPAGADRIGPDLRAPHAVRVAGLRVLLMGCTALAVRVLLSRARMARESTFDPAIHGRS